MILRSRQVVPCLDALSVKVIEWVRQMRLSPKENTVVDRAPGAGSGSSFQ